MSNRINTITVVLEEDVREEGCEAILTSILMTKGVLSAAPNVASASDYMAQQRARHELVQKLREVLYPKSN